MTITRTHYAVLRTIASRCRLLTASVLYDLVDHLDDLEYWLGCVDIYGLDTCRGDIIAESVHRLGVARTLRVILCRA